MIYLFTHNDSDYTEFNGYYYYDEETIICVMLSDYYIYEPKYNSFVRYETDKYFVIPPKQITLDINTYDDLNYMIEKYMNLIIFDNI